MEEVKKTRRGRPKLAPEEKRVHRVRLKFTEKEFLQLEQEMKDADYKQLAFYVHQKLVAREGQLVHNPRAALRALERLGIEVAAIGKNINQLARYANFLKANSVVKPQVLEDYTRELRRLTELELEMQKAVRGFFREGSKKHSK